MSGPAPWVVFDYGAVLSEPQDEGCWAAMRAVSGCEVAALQDGYWAHRDGFDTAELSSTAYWAKVLGRPVHDVLAAELDRLDVASWSRTRAEVLALLPRLAAADSRLAVLSNAPRPLAAAIRTTEWIGAFAHVLFSCDLGVTKPNPAIYARLLATLDAAPGDVAFVDDREDNVAAAVGAGIDAVLCRDGAVAPADLAGRLGIPAADR